MSRRPGRGRRALAAMVVGLAAASSAPLVQAGDVIVFACAGSPRETWATGYGAALSSTWFQVINLEGEAGRLPGGAPESSMTSFTASALLAPPLGSLTPYGGLGVGLFRQSLGSHRDTGTLKALVLGAKIKLKGLLVLKAEYRRLDLSGTPLLTLQSRFSAGAGVAF